MKIRNGFVSNSSSSSFILTLPKDKNIRLSEIEDYLGGYSDELTDDKKDNLSFFLWKTINTRKHPIDNPMEHHEECTAYWEDMKRLEREHRCLGHSYWSEEGEPAPDRCKDCEFYRHYDRPTRSDDYYTIRDNEWITNKSILDEDKDNYYLVINDSDPGDYLDYDSAYELRRVSPLFKCHDNVQEVDG